MPNIITRGALSAQGFGFASINKTHFIGTLYDPNGAVGGGNALDSAGNFYVIGASNLNVEDEENIQLAKYYSYGPIQSQTKINYSGSNNTMGLYLYFDSLDNYYIGTYPYPYVMKYNSSNVFQWGYYVGNLRGAVYADLSGNSYHAGAISGDFWISKFNSSGTVVWEKYVPVVSGGFSELLGANIRVDNSGNIYFCCTYYDGSKYYLYFAKMNSSGTLQWTRYLSTSVNVYGSDITHDSSGNVYVCGYTSTYAVIAKYNSAGTIQWQRKLSSTVQFNSIAVDGSSNVYVAGKNGSGSALIVKYNSSGVIQWQRTLTGGSGLGSSEFITIRTDTNNNLYVCGNSSVTSIGSYLFLVASFGADGSSSGTYTVGSYNYTYAPSSLTDAIGTLTSSNGAVTILTGSTTSGSLTFTATPSSLTSAVTPI
jgi:hypothetical protein